MRSPYIEKKPFFKNACILSNKRYITMAGVIYLTKAAQFLVQKSLQMAAAPIAGVLSAIDGNE